MVVGTRFASNRRRRRSIRGVSDNDPPNHDCLAQEVPQITPLALAKPVVNHPDLFRKTFPEALQARMIQQLLATEGRVEPHKVSSEICPLGPATFQARNLGTRGTRTCSTRGRGTGQVCHIWRGHSCRRSRGWIRSLRQRQRSSIAPSWRRVCARDKVWYGLRRRAQQAILLRVHFGMEMIKLNTEAMITVVVSPRILRVVLDGRHGEIRNDTPLDYVQRRQKDSFGRIRSLRHRFRAVPQIGSCRDRLTDGTPTLDRNATNGIDRAAACQARTKHHVLPGDTKGNCTRHGICDNGGGELGHHRVMSTDGSTCGYRLWVHTFQWWRWARPSRMQVHMARLVDEAERFHYGEGGRTTLQPTRRRTKMQEHL
jgi:hypothetical protein